MVTPRVYEKSLLSAHPSVEISGRGTAVASLEAAEAQQVGEASTPSDGDAGHQRRVERRQPQ